MQENTNQDATIKKEEHKETTHKQKPKRKFPSTNPFPFNYREWLPNIDMSLLLSKLQNKDYLIRVMSYNILCDSLLPVSTKIPENATTQFPYLQWSFRAKQLLNEITQISPDIICFQEIEKDENYFIPGLHLQGFEIAIKPRTGEHSEGCGIAWKKSKFNIIELYALELNMNINKIKDQSELYDRDNIALFAILTLKSDPHRVIIVCSSHLLFNTKRGDIKLGQAYQIVQTLNLLKHNIENTNKDNKVYIIFGCDLNSVPKSGIYKLLTQGCLNCEHVDQYKLSGQDPDNLEYIYPATKIKSHLCARVSSKYNDDIPHKNNQNEAIQRNRTYNNVKWYNEITKVEPVLVLGDNNAKYVKLDYKNGFRFKESDITLNIPLKLFSAYSVVPTNILKYLEHPEKENKKIPFSLIENKNVFDGFEINCIKIFVNELNKTLDYAKKLTKDVSYTSYSSFTITATDYIFYYGNDINCIRILNLPDVFEITFDVGFLPTNEFPSDHLSLAADFVIGEINN